MIGQRLRISRLAAGLSLRDLGAKIDNRVTAQVISKYERNESMPSSGVLIALADALDMTVDYLMGDGDLVLRAEIGKHRNSMGWRELFELKRVFGVSVQALTWRCKDLGIFSNTLFRRLLDEFTRRGWRSPPYQEPCAMRGEKPRRFERLCYRALVEGAVSRAKGRRASRDLGARVEPPHRGTP